jgi:hypothetical protein
VKLRPPGSEAESLHPHVGRPPGGGVVVYVTLRLKHPTVVTGDDGSNKPTVVYDAHLDLAHYISPYPI